MNTYGAIVTKIMQVPHRKGLHVFAVTYEGPGVAGARTVQRRNTVPGGDLSVALAQRGIPDGRVDVIVNGRHQIVALRETATR